MTTLSQRTCQQSSSFRGELPRLLGSRGRLRFVDVGRFDGSEAANTELEPLTIFMELEFAAAL